MGWRPWFRRSLKQNSLVLGFKLRVVGAKASLPSIVSLPSLGLHLSKDINATL